MSDAAMAASSGVVVSRLSMALASSQRCQHPLRSSQIKHAARVMVPLHSTAGVLGGMNPTYCVSKAVVIGAIRILAAELDRYDMRVNTISPHAIAALFGLHGLVELILEASKEDLRRMVERGIMNEMGGMVLEVEDIARAAMYLTSDEAKYVNNLVIDGGFTAGKLIHTPELDPVKS